jgi:hypothetical protein
MGALGVSLTNHLYFVHIFQSPELLISSMKPRIVGQTTTKLQLISQALRKRVCDTLGAVFLDKGNKTLQ